MATTVDEKEFRQRMQRVEELLQQVDSFADPAVRAHVREIVQTLMDFHGIGLERILGHLAGAGEAGRGILDALARDDLVGSLLLLYGLHPVGLADRVRLALDRVRPYLRSHGVSVELLSLTGDVVRLRMQGSGHDCASSAVTVKQTIEEAILATAPEVTAVEIEEDHAAPGDNGRSRVALPLLGR